ncbi:helix-turn-helix domain-containing protein [soil metagenome]
MPAMERADLKSLACPIARSLGVVGECWSILIIRDALKGLRRFDEFQSHLGIASNMLTRRLKALVEVGVLERHRYQERPARYEYRPTQAAYDFQPVIFALLAWGNRHLAPDGESVIVIDSQTGHAVTPVMIDAPTGLPLTDPRFRLGAGPAADGRTRARLRTPTRT